jgi:hypothetical protein
MLQPPERNIREERPGVLRERHQRSPDFPIMIATNLGDHYGSVPHPQLLPGTRITLDKHG